MGWSDLIFLSITVTELHLIHSILCEGGFLPQSPKPCHKRKSTKEIFFYRKLNYLKLLFQ